MAHLAATTALARSAKAIVADHFSPATGPSRCFPFWQEVLACYVINTTSEDDSGKKKCGGALEDYYECLHHKKEVRPSEPHEVPGHTDAAYMLSGRKKADQID